MVALATLASKANLKTLIAQCEAQVKSRQWATWDIWSPQPYWFERNQYPRGRRLKAKPAKNKDAKLYGYDAAGQVVRIRSWSGFLGTWHEEELFVRKGRELIAYQFNVDGRLMSVVRYTHDHDARLLRREMYALRTKRSGTERYVWKDGLLTDVRVTNWGQSWKLRYDELGQLEVIEAIWKKTGASEVYRRPARGEKLADLLAVVRDRLLELIPRVIAKTKPKQRAVMLALVIDEEEWRYILPPSLALGFEAGAWDVNDLPQIDVPRDARLDAAAKRANQHLWKSGAYSKVKPLMRDLVRELQSIDWKKMRAVSDDFLVFSTTLEGDARRDAKRDAPPALRKRLFAR